MARILIVDDAEQNLLLYQLYLKGGEFEVATARGGKQALEAVACDEFDLILLDVVMPDMGGIEVCRRLKAIPRTASIPVIFFTGRLRDEADREIAYEVGAVDYLTKPVDKQELVARIRVMLRFRQERADLERKNADLADAVRRSTALISAVAEQLEDNRSLIEARSEEGSGVVVMDSQTRVLGMSSVARELFPDLEIGAVIRETDTGPLGTLAEFLDSDLTEGGRDVEVQADGGAVLRIGIERVPDMDVSVLRVSDVSRENHIKQRLISRMPEDLAAKIEEIAIEGRGSYQISKFVGRSRVLRELTEQVDKLRQSRCTTLIHGETGSGKELIASALHYDGPHGSRPFIPIHCGAISKELIESELFGYEKGAFTGATTHKDGLFAACDGGTIFLDEIADTSLDLQVKLLRVLQQGEVRPVGATSPRPVDVRIIAATNKDLKQLVREGGSAKTSTTDSMSSPCTCRRCVSARTTSHSWSPTSSRS